MSDKPYEKSFREWFEDNVNTDDIDMKAAIYRPMYSAFLAGATCAIEQLQEKHDERPVHRS